MAPHNLGDGVAARQSILDSAMHLMALRRRVLDDLSRQGKTPGGELVGVDADLGAWAMEQSHTWRHLLSTRPVTRAADLSRSMPNTRLALAGGLRMTSVFDRHGTDAGARRILEREPEGAYFFSHAPLEMRVIDHRMVWLAGPQEPRSILQLTSAQALDAAMKHWYAVLAQAVPCRVEASADSALTPRQRAIVELLLQDKTDEEVSRVLQVSVRTVRGEVAAVMAALGVHSRVGLGYVYALTDTE